MAKRINFNVSLISLVVISIVLTLVFLLLKEESAAARKVQAVAIGRSNLATGDTLVYSYDGLKWNSTTGASFNYNVNEGYYVEGGVNYGNEMWVATGWNSLTNKNILYSNDGIDWKEASRRDGMSIFYNGDSSDIKLRGNATAFGNNRWVAVGKAFNNENILYSDDAITWYPAGMSSSGTSTFPGTSNFDGGKDVFYGKDKWVAVGKSTSNENNILYSTNGISWEKALMSDGTSPFISSTNSAGLGVYYDDHLKQWFATGKSTSRDNLLVSPDGICWRVRDADLEGGNFFAGGCYDIVYSSEKNGYIATGLDTVNTNLAFSDNSLQWADTAVNGTGTSPFSDGFVNGLGVNYSDNLNRWFAVGGAGTIPGGAILTSTDGSFWDPTKMSDDVNYPFDNSSTGTVAYGLAVRD